MNDDICKTSSDTSKYSAYHYSLGGDGFLDGSNPKADAELAAAIGCKITDEIPLVAIGPRGFEVSEKGEPVNLRRSPMVEEFLQTYAEMSQLERTAFRMGLMYAGSLLIELSDHHYELTGKLQSEATRLRAM